MILFPAIDVYEGKAVRLYKGDYAQMTVYGTPTDVVKDFVRCGATHAHLVDLEGAKTGTTPNFDVIRRVKEESGLFCEVGGGIRAMSTVTKYLSAGIDRVILGTAAVKDAEFLKAAVETYGEKIAVGVDVKDGFVAIKGWTEKSGWTSDAFCEKLLKIGVKTIICTDVSKDGAMQGPNVKLYEALRKYPVNVIASGGVSSMEDLMTLKKAGTYGAIVGKAYYTGAVTLTETIKAVK